MLEPNYRVLYTGNMVKENEMIYVKREEFGGTKGKICL
jgi:hypothetical protein